MDNVNNLNGVSNFGHGDDTPGETGAVPAEEVQVPVEPQVEEETEELE